MRGEDFDLAGFSVGAVDRDKLLPRPDIAAGDVVLGLASSGVHSNGYSLVRRLVADSGLRWTDDAPFAPGTPLGEALLTPTRIYVPAILRALRESTGIKALAHITGGGITENVPRVLPDDLGVSIDLEAIALPPVFAWLREAGQIEQAEMLRTFNCGVGMVAVVSPEHADEIIHLLGGAGETTTRIGTVTSREGEAVRYEGQL